MDEDRKNRVAKANNVYYQICNGIIGKKEISTNVNTKIYKTAYLSTLKVPPGGL
jgi:hypothetical protein